MKITQLVEEDFVNYRKPSLFLGFSTCTFKCNKEAGRAVCQNELLIKSVTHNLSVESIIGRYISNPITSAIVLGGLEPLDDFSDVLHFVGAFRKISTDDIVIYTGYNKNEVQAQISELKKFSNIYVKFGRYIPDQEPHYDPVLGVSLASDNQYGERIS